MIVEMDKRHEKYYKKLIRNLLKVMIFFIILIQESQLGNLTFFGIIDYYVLTQLLLTLFRTFKKM
jgi:hypothetical protein